MSETQVNNNMYREDESKGEDEDEDEEENNGEVERNSWMVVGLNLALILSSLTLSEEEKDIKKIGEGLEKGKMSGRNMNMMPKRVAVQVNEVRAGERQMGRAANKGNCTKIRDCRHGRKM